MFLCKQMIPIFTDVAQHYSRYPSMSSRGVLCTPGNPSMSSRGVLCAPGNVLGPSQGSLPLQMHSQLPQHPPRAGVMAADHSMVNCDPATSTTSVDPMTHVSGENPNEHQRRYRVRTRKSKTQLRDYLQVSRLYK